MANNTNIVISVHASGVGTLSYQWFLNGTSVPNDLITRIAGNGLHNNNYFDNVPATNSPLSNPFGIAVDSHGNLFIADSGNSRIARVDTNGIITTFVNTNFLSPAGFSGDGGPATKAKLNFPKAVAVDSFGNLFIADVGNYRIRKVNTNGIITTIAGNGTNGFSGDGGPATNAEFAMNGPGSSSLCLDTRGNIYLADAGNMRIRKIDTNGIVSTLANGGYTGGVTVDAVGNVFFSNVDRVLKCDTNNVVTTVAGGGTNLVGGIAATNVQISPFGLYLDTNGNLFFGDLSDNRRAVRKVDTNGILTTVAGTGVSGNKGDGG